MNTDIVTKTSEEVASNAYKELAKYTAKTRSFPGMLDGLKTSYRRTLVQTEKYKKFTKSATLVGETMKTHVHGDSSIYGVLINMTCRYERFPLFNGKGNFGGLSFSASSSRYTEAYINDVARLIYLDLLDYADYEDGEVDNQEPRYLPSLLPYCFLAGSAGMTVGLPTPNIPALSPLELIDFCIAKLRNETPVYPHLNEGKCIAITPKNEIDNILKSGNGKVRFRPLIQKESSTTLVINEGTPGAYIDKSVSKLQKLINEEVISFTNESSQNGYRYVFTINNSSRITIEELYNKLSNSLSSTVTYRIITEKDGIVYYSSLDSIIDSLLNYLETCTVRKFYDLCKKLEFKLNVYEAINKLKNSDILNNIKDYSIKDLKNYIISIGYSSEVSSEVVGKPISYLTKEYDLEIASTTDELYKYRSYISNIKDYLVSKYNDLRSIIQCTMKQYCTRTLSEEELSKYSTRKVVLYDNKIISRKRGGVLLGDTSNVILVTKDCKFCRISIPSTEEESYDLPEDYEYIGVDNDIGKYLVVMYYDKNDNTYMSSDYTDSIRVGIDTYIRLRYDELDLYTPVKFITTDKDSIELYDDNGVKYVFDSKYYVHDKRKRFPTYISDHKLKFND